MRLAVEVSSNKRAQNPSGLVIYKCVICGKSWMKRESLQAHMRVHQDIDWKTFNVRLPKKKVDAFKDYCKRHNTTTCHMILAIMDMCLTADEVGHAALGSANPVVFTLQQFFNAKPRGKRKYDLQPIPFGPLEDALSCNHLRQKEWVEGRLGWCSRCGRWVTPGNCVSCVERGSKLPPRF